MFQIKVVLRLKSPFDFHSTPGDLSMHRISRWWSGLRSDPTVPPWLRLACLSIAVLVIYSWTVGIGLKDVIVRPGPCPNNYLVHGGPPVDHWFLDISEDVLFENDFCPSCNLVLIAIFVPWACAGFLATATARQGAKYPLRTAQLLSGIGFFSFPALVLMFTISELEVQLASTGPDFCEHGGLGYFEGFGAWAPLFYPLLMIILAVLSLRRRLFPAGTC